jgi:hypothetical protein
VEVDAEHGRMVTPLRTEDALEGAPVESVQGAGRSGWRSNSGLDAR